MNIPNFINSKKCIEKNLIDLYFERGKVPWQLNWMIVGLSKT